MRIAAEVVLTEEQKRLLERLSRSSKSSVRLAQRARIVLLAAQGLQNKAIAGQVGLGRVPVARWRERWLESGLEGIERDLPRGAPAVKGGIDDAKPAGGSNALECAQDGCQIGRGAEYGLAALAKNGSETEFEP